MPHLKHDDIEINYEVHGEGTPLVLAHGYTATLEMWRAQAAAFSARYKLVIYDLRGHGDSGAPADTARYGLAREYVADELALMDHLGIERAYVGGLSMGGMIAQEFVLQHPDRVRAALFFDTGPGFGGPQRDAAITARFEQAQKAMQLLARTKGMAAIVDAMRGSAAAFAPAAGAAAPDGVRAHLDGMRKMSVDGYLGGARAMQEWAGTVDRLSQITAPALVLVGERDNLLGPSRVIHERIAGSRFVLLRNSGHGTAVWRPHAFAAATLEFLADVDAGRAVAGDFIVD
jgi:pimeloyl-ACP methyl ester carboxylesterase